MKKMYAHLILTCSFLLTIASTKIEAKNTKPKVHAKKEKCCKKCKHTHKGKTNKKPCGCICHQHAFVEVFPQNCCNKKKCLNHYHPKLVSIGGIGI